MPALVIVAALLVATLAACGSNVRRDSAANVTRATSTFDQGLPLKPGENPAAQRLAGKRRGGTLTAYTSEDLISLDPGQAYFVLDYAIVYATQRTLFAYRTNSDSTLIPDLAAYMPTTANGGISDGGRTLTVHIRTDVHFGPPVNRAVTSADIAYAIERGEEPSVANAYFPSYFGWDAAAPLDGAGRSYRGGPIPGIRTPNRSTIVFHMTTPGATFLIEALSLPLSAPVPESFAGPLDRHSPTAYGTSYLVATGPYMVKSSATGMISGIGYQAGEWLTLVRNPNWRRSTDYRPAYLDRIDVKMGGASALIGERVLKGSDAVELDHPAAPIIAQAYASSSSQVVFTEGGGGDHYLALDNAAGPMRNVDVRRAVWAALDRAAIARAAGGPLLALPGTHFIYPGVLGYQQAGGAAGPRVSFNTDIDGDLRVARQYMRLAGYPSGRYTGKATIQIVGDDTGTAPGEIEIVNRAFTSLGFRTRVREADQSVMYGYCGVPKAEIDACPSVGWVRDFADPESVLYPPFYGAAITATNNANWGQVDDPKINVAMSRAALVVGTAARVQAWAGVDRLLVGQAVAVPETFDNVASIESRDVAGVTAIWNSGIWDLDYTSLR
jgi:peptide/nickel transport system substrate-binding protein